MTEAPADAALVNKVKTLLREIEVGERFSVEFAAGEVKAELDRLTVRPDANYDRALDLCLRAWSLLRNVTGDQTQEWADSKDFWQQTLSAELLLAEREQI